MKKICVAIVVWILSVTTIVCCSKAKVEQKVEDLAIKWTDDTWIVTKFQGDPDVITTDFARVGMSVLLKFYRWGKKRYSKVAGTWNASTSAQTITSQVHAGSPVPLEKINGIWKIVKTNYTFAEFLQTKNGTDYRMELTKKEFNNIHL